MSIHHCEKWDELVNNSEYRLTNIRSNGEITKVEDCTDNMFDDSSLDFQFCPYCKAELDKEKPKSQLQILQEKKDDMVKTKALVDGLNVMIDDWYSDQENGHT